MRERSEIMRKRFLCIWIILIISFFLTGCWDSRELNTLGVSLVMGFDIEDNGEILLTAEVIKPASAKRGLGEQEIKYVQGRGKSFLEALRSVTLKFDRRLFISHLKVLIFSEDFAKGGNIEYMDFFQRDEELRETSYILIAKNAKAYEVMGVAAGIEDVPANYILQLVENKKYNIKTVDVDVLQFIKYYYEENLQPVVGVIEKKEKSPVGKGSLSKKEKDDELSVEGATVFSKDKLVGYLNGIETRGFNFIIDEVEGGVIEFPTPNTQVDEYSIPTPKVESMSRTFAGEKNKATVVEVIKSKTKKDVKINNGKIIFEIKVKMKGTLDEVVGDIDTSKEEVIKELEKGCSAEIKSNMEKVIGKAQKEFKVDIFETASLFHRKYPKEWHKIKKDWDKIFPEAEFKVEVETNILRTGLINTPTNKIKGE